MRTWRRSGAVASVPVPISVVVEPGRDPESARRPPLRAISRQQRRPRRPRPGVSKRYGLEDVGLARAIVADSRTKPRPRLDRAAAA